MWQCSPLNIWFSQLKWGTNGDWYPHINFATYYSQLSGEQCLLSSLLACQAPFQCINLSAQQESLLIRVGTAREEAQRIKEFDYGNFFVQCHLFAHQCQELLFQECWKKGFGLMASGTIPFAQHAISGGAVCCLIQAIFCTCYSLISVFLQYICIAFSGPQAES